MKNMKKFVGLSLAALMAVSMTACGSGSGNSSSGSKAESGSAASSAASSASSGESSASAEGGVFKIGGIGPTTGGASAYGQAVQKGAELAVEEINAAGGINGAMIESNLKMTSMMRRNL